MSGVAESLCLASISADGSEALRHCILVTDGTRARH